MTTSDYILEYHRRGDITEHKNKVIDELHDAIQEVRQENLELRKQLESNNWEEAYLKAKISDLESKVEYLAEIKNTRTRSIYSNKP